MRSRVSLYLRTNVIDGCLYPSSLSGAKDRHYCTRHQLPIFQAFFLSDPVVPMDVIPIVTIRREDCSILFSLSTHHRPPLPTLYSLSIASPSIYPFIVLFSSLTMCFSPAIIVRLPLCPFSFDLFASSRLSPFFRLFSPMHFTSLGIFLAPVSVSVCLHRLSPCSF